jgi:hypothetical protein
MSHLKPVLKPSQVFNPRNQHLQRCLFWERVSGVFDCCVPYFSRVSGHLLEGKHSFGRFQLVAKAETSTTSRRASKNPKSVDIRRSIKRFGTLKLHLEAELATTQAIQDQTPQVPSDSIVYADVWSRVQRELRQLSILDLEKQLSGVCKQLSDLYKELEATLRNEEARETAFHVARQQIRRETRAIEHARYESTFTETEYHSSGRERSRETRSKVPPINRGGVVGRVREAIGSWVGDSLRAIGDGFG